VIAMTLITYPTRVHFADGVLEEALRAELEAHGYRRPLILSEEEAVETEFTERLYAGLPRKARPRHVAIGPFDSKYQTAQIAEVETRKDRPDVIVAYGSGRAIAHARKCRHDLHQTGRDHGLAREPVEIFAVPGVDGLPNPCRSMLAPSDALLDVSTRTGLPSIVICDPTLAAQADSQAALCAATDALSRSLEAYLSEAYNPPADGMAFDGVDRAVRCLTMGADVVRPEGLRELMAASLNATLAQQKGIGPTQILGDILSEPHGNRFRPGALTRVLLPQVLAATTPSAARRARIECLLGGDAPLLTQVNALLSPLPFPRRLSDLGLTQADILSAISKIEGPISAAIARTAEGAQAIMEAAL